MSRCARACACGLPPTATVDGLEIEAAGPLVLLENFPELFRGSLWLRLVSGSFRVSPSRSAARARTERELLCRHVVGAAHPLGWEHSGAPRRALRGGFLIPRTPGSHRF